MSEDGKKALNYWKKSAEEDFLTAQALLTAKRNLGCLFFCHLAIEKILKALHVAKKNSAPPLVHDLVNLAKQLDLNIQDTEEDLREISRFNVTARYDDYKFSMYKRADDDFTKKYFVKAKEIYQWLKQQL